MKLRTRLLLLALVFVVTSAVEVWWLAAIQPGLNARLALNQFANDDRPAEQLRVSGYLGDSLVLTSVAVQLAAAWLLIARPILDARRRVRTTCLIEE